ncbi:MAG: LysR family transcriptional regulator [Thermoguttaceae bacterium]|nr:LysR family transcriptional regulator [Thermoguttaceae bacterium]
MNIETFRIFCDVVHYQSFSRGAEANNISQSAATQSIHRLEKQLGTQLVDRTKRPFVLTQEGQICYEGFREILETYDSVVTRVQTLYNQGGGTIHVAAIYSVGLHDMSKCMREFMKECPKTKIRLEFLHPSKVYQAVLNSEADLGIVSYPTTSPELNVIPLRSEEMVVVAPPNHPLAKEKTLTLEQLQNVEYVAFDRDLFIRKETDRYMRQRGVHVEVAMEFDNIETIKQAIEVGVGVSILPAPTVVSDVESGKMVAIPLVSPKLTRPIGVIYKHRKVFSAQTTRFIEMLGGALVNSDASFAPQTAAAPTPESPGKTPENAD